MKVGCVKEIKNNEFRVGMTPDNVKSYVNVIKVIFFTSKLFFCLSNSFSLVLQSNLLPVLPLFLTTGIMRSS